MREPLAAIDIPAPTPDALALSHGTSGTLTVTRTTPSYWRRRRNPALNHLLKSLKPLPWPQKVEPSMWDRPDPRAEDKAERARQEHYYSVYSRGYHQRLQLQAFLLAIAETDRRLAKELDLTARSLEVSINILRGKAVSRAARRDTDTPLVARAQAIVDEINALGLATDGAVQERTAGLISELEAQLAEAKAAIAAAARCWEADHALMEKVGRKANAVFARVDHYGESEEAAALAEQKATAAYQGRAA